MAIAAATGVLSTHQDAGLVVEERRQAGVHQRDLDVATDAGLPSFVERSEYTDGRVVAGEHVDDGNADTEGASADLAGEVHDAAHALNGQVVTRQVGSVGVATERGDGRGDDVGLVRRKRRSVEPELCHEAGLEVVEHDVAGEGESAGERNVVGVLEVEHDRPLIAIDGHVIRGFEILGLIVGRVVLPRGTPGAGVVAVAGAFDLDHVGAEIAEDLPDQWPSEDSGEIDDPNAVERPRLRHGLQFGSNVTGAVAARRGCRLDWSGERDLWRRPRGPDLQLGHRLHPRDAQAAQLVGPLRRPRPDPFPTGAERFSAHWARQVDLPQLRCGRRVRRHDDAALR